MLPLNQKEDKETHCRVRRVQSWKTWKVIKFKNFIFFPGLEKSWNLIVGPGKSCKIKVMFGELVTVECQSKDNVRLR